MSEKVLIYGLNNFFLVKNSNWSIYERWKLKMAKMATSLIINANCFIWKKHFYRTILGHSLVIWVYYVSWKEISFQFFLKPKNFSVQSVKSSIWRKWLIKKKDVVAYHKYEALLPLKCNLIDSFEIQSKDLYPNLGKSAFTLSKLPK